MIRSLETNRHDASEYTRITIYQLEKNNITLITREVYIIDNLSINVLIKIDIISSEDIILDL